MLNKTHQLLKAYLPTARYLSRKSDWALTTPLLLGILTFTVVFLILVLF